MGGTIANIGSGLISGFLFGEGIRRNRVQDERAAAQDERAAAQEGRRAEMDGLTIQNAKNTAAEYDANAPARQGALSEKLAAQKEAAEARLNEQSLFLADKQYQIEGDLSGYKNAFKAADPNYELHSIEADPKTGEITIEVADIMGGTITPKKFKDYSEFTGTLAKLSSPSAYKSAIAQAQAQREKLEAEDREEQRDVRGDKRKHASAVELANLNNSSKFAIQELKIAALEAGKTGRLVSVADRGKLAVELAKTFKGDRAYRGKTPKQRMQEAKSIIDSMYGEQAPSVPAPADSPAAGGLSKADAGARPPAEKPAGFVRTGTDASGRKVGLRADGTIVDIATGKAVQ